MQENSSKVTTVTTGINKFNPTVNNCSTNEVNILLQDCSELIHTDFKDWYARTFYKLPARRVLELASQAKVDGQHPPKLFSFLLKLEVAKIKP